MTVPAQRIDKWLWYARFFKSRSQAAREVQAGKIRINRQRVMKASAGLKVGDILTFCRGSRVLVVQVMELGARRGPSEEAQGLYFLLNEQHPTPQHEMQAAE